MPTKDIQNYLTGWPSLVLLGNGPTQRPLYAPQFEPPDFQLAPELKAVAWLSIFLEAIHAPAGQPMSVRGIRMAASAWVQWLGAGE